MKYMKIKVVHFIMTLWPAGLEIWLLRLIKQMNHEKYEFHIIVQKQDKADLESEFERLGVQIHRCLRTNNPIRFIKNIYTTIGLIGDINVLHSHVHHFSGLILFLGWLKRIPVRISHCHSDTRLKKKKDKISKKVYSLLMEILLEIFATKKLAVSFDAANDLYMFPNKVILLPCGIDIKEFDSPIETKKQLCNQFYVPETSKIIIHIGRFTYSKNHDFLIDVFNNVSKNDKDLFLLLIGTGELYKKVVTKVNELEIVDKVRFLGVRRDISALLSISNLFLFPSLYEGLGVSVIEAQAVGLRCVISAHLPTELTINKEIVFREDISAGINVWAKTVMNILKMGPSDKKAAMEIISNSSFNIKKNVMKLDSLYS